MRIHQKRTRLGRLSLRFFSRIRYNVNTDYEAWCILFDDFRKIIGLDPDFIKYIEDKNALQQAQIRFIKGKKINGRYVRDRKILNTIKRLQIEIDLFEQENTGEKRTITSVLVALYRGEKLPLLHKRDLTVEVYFTLIKSDNSKQAA